MTDETVVLLTNSFGAVLKVFRASTPQISKHDKLQIERLAASFNQRVQFHVVPWSGIEAVKWDIREMNGDT